MGANCKIYLPANVRIHHVARVVGRLSGGVCTRNVLNKTTWAADVADVRVSPTSVISMAEIHITRTCVDRENIHHTFYHFESEGGLRLLAPRSTAFWLIVGARLVDFFGGHVVFNDCGDSETDYDAPHKPNSKNCPEDGSDWQDLQKRIEEIVPITETEWRSWDRYAAYKIDD